MLANTSLKLRRLGWHSAARRISRCSASALRPCAAAACFNPEEAVPLWQRMSEASGGQAPPEFSSTHPNPGTRIQNLTALMPKAMAYRAKFCPQGAAQ